MIAAQRKKRVALDGPLRIIPGMKRTPAEFLSARDFSRVAAAIRYLGEHREQRPTLTDVARHVGLSNFYFNRMFRRWAGVTPKQYLDVLNGHAAMQALRSRDSVLDAALETGLSGPGRLHDLMIELEAATPGELRGRGRDLVIRWGQSESPFGLLVMAETPRGLCHLSFEETAMVQAPAVLRERWPLARFERDDARAAEIAAQLLGLGTGSAPLRLRVVGSNFQLRVWRALLERGAHETLTYGELARALRMPKAARAVGNAVGANPIAWLIPCHHVLRENGALGGYRWGVDRKRAMLAWESLRSVRGSARGTGAGPPPG
jgi:AraC family transcriptional regulator, regulatory protein of adaptative response / methylated-DNA-[protein]-cysteine methyltransferase